MDPYKQLARLLENRMAQHAGRAVAGLFCELGTITATGLKLDGFKHEIRDYLVADWLVKMHLPAFNITGSQTGLKDSLNGDVTGQATFSFQPASVDEVRLEFKADLKPGDRVLAVPVNGGQEAVVICKVVG